MAEQVKFDYSLTAGVISEDEMKAMEKITKDAKDVLVGKSGAGNDFLGWIDLPVDYDKEEFSRIQKAAQKIQSDSEVLLVIGIGGSYLGARAASSSYVTAFTIMYPRRSARHRRSIIAETT